MKKMKITKETKIKLIVLGVLCFLTIGFACITFIFAPKIDEPVVGNVLEDIEVEREIKEDELTILKKSYEENKKINDDYVGQIYFDSKLIDLPFVQGETNDKYMRTDWKTMNYDAGGSIFVEASNNILIDQNLVIYGHNYSVSQDPTSTKFFSPLRALMNSNNYEDNKIINIFLGDKILKYEVIYVYKVKVLEEDGVQYLDEGEPYYDTINFSEEEFNDYINKVIEREYYSTGKSITYDDKMLTLQTCIDDILDKLVINAKLIDIIDINSL